MPDRSHPRRDARRRWLRTPLAAGAGLALPGWLVSRPSVARNGGDDPQASLVTRKIPRSGESLPVVGMGTWITFNIGADNTEERRERADVMRAFFAGGGRMIDSSPMYGRAEEVVGELLQVTGTQSRVFSTTKIWTPGQWAGRAQLRRSLELWRLPKLDLVQVHNLLDVRAHWPTLLEARAEGRIRYLGVTTSHGSRHDELMRLMRELPLDFVQFSYSVPEREAEQRLLPMAADKGIAVIINRPFDGGSVFSQVRGRPLPGWAAELGCSHWAQLLLKFVVSHPAVTCAIPATRQPAHMAQDIAAARGPMPDERQRARIVAAFAGE